MFHWKKEAKDQGLYLGRFLDGSRSRDEVFYNDSIHCCTIGPNGSGKGTGVIVPNLAALRRSVFVIDSQGEAAAITAPARARLGPVKIINPFNVFADELPYLTDTGYNPMAALDPTHDNFTDD